MTKLLKEHEWIKKHPEVIEKFSGQWIAIWQEEVVAGNDDLEEVAKKAGQTHPGSKPLFFKVPRKDEEMYILWN